MRLPKSALFLALSLVALSCGSSGGPPLMTMIEASFTPGGTAASADNVRLVGSAAGNRVIIDIVISGPTTSGDLYSFAFDLVLGDANIASYLGGSVIFGSALTIGATQQAQVLANQNGNRVAIGVTKLGGGSGNGIGGSAETIVTLAFEVLQRGMTTITIAGSPPNAPAALDSTGAIVNSVQFDPIAAVITGG